MATKITDDGLTPTIRTRKQELGSAWIIRRALKDNQKYSSWEDITKDKKYVELAGSKGIYPEVTTEWLKVFFKQQEKMLEEFASAKFTEFNREYGFMDYISKLVAEKFGITQKDTWDPADIWCIKNQNKVLMDVKKLVAKNQFETVSHLNAYLRTLFKDRIVVGISLKKISGKQAKYEEVNTEDFEFPEPKKPNYKLSYLRVDLTLKSGTSGKNSQAGVKNSDFWVEGEEHGKKVTFKIDIKPSSSSKFTFIAFDAKSTAAASARMGKVPVETVKHLLNEYKIPIDWSAQNYPKTTAEYMEREDEFISMFKKIKKNNFILTNITSEEDFKNTMKNLFMNPEKGKSVTANSKCQQVALFAGLSTLSKDELSEMGTKMIFAAQKKGAGDKYGPFGKLY